VFYGEYEHTVDAKGRLIIPSRLREVIVKRELAPLTICQGLDQCLFLFGEKDWKEFEDRLRSLPLEQADARRVTREFFSSAAPCELDKQGRIMIPGKLRKYAALDGDVTVMGVLNRIEIWNRARWNEYHMVSSTQFEDTAEHLWSLQTGGSRQ